MPNMKTNTKSGTRMAHKPTVERGVPFTETPPSIDEEERWSIVLIPSEGQYRCWRKSNTSFGSHVSISLSKKHLGHMALVGNLDARSSSLEIALSSRSAASRARRTLTGSSCTRTYSTYRYVIGEHLMHILQNLQGVHNSRTRTCIMHFPQPQC